MSKGNVSPTGKTDKHGVANGQPVDHRILTPDEVAAPFPPSGKLPTIREAFLTEEELDAGEVNVLTVCTARRPNDHEFFRVRPGETWRCYALLVEYQGEDPTLGRGPFLIHPTLRAKFGTLGRPHLLVMCITSGGTVFLWPIHLVKGFGDTWSKSALHIVGLAEQYWVRKWSVRGSGGYQAAISKHDHGEPQWPEESFEELVALAFGDTFVTALDHPLCRALEID